MLLQAKILGVYYYWLFLFDANWERDRVLKAVYLSSVNFEFMLLALPLLTDNEFLFIPNAGYEMVALYTAYLPSHLWEMSPCLTWNYL